MRQILSIVFLLVFFFIQAQPGSLDLEFNSSDNGFGLGDGANEYVKDILIQSDNKIIIGGDFTTYNTNSSKYLARINPDGSFDNTFLIGSGASHSVTSFLKQSDGKIIVCGNFTSFNGVAKNRIIRLNPNGSIDSSFNIGTGADGVVECAALQQDGKILIGGQFSKFNSTTRKYIARLNSDGTLDNTFESTVGFNSYVYSIAVQNDGKILVGGNFTTYNSVAKNYVVRLNSDASIDDTFSSTGANSTVYKVLISNEKIYLGGRFSAYNDTSKNGIVKIKEDGSIDDSFTTSSGANSTVRNILILQDNKLMLAGGFTSYASVSRNYITKINEDGTIDPSFNPGKAFGNSTTSLQQQSDGKLVIGGSFLTFNNNVKRYVTRVNLDGSIDSSFNPGNAADGNIRSIAVQNDKKIIVAGSFNSFNDHMSNSLARIDENGVVDESLNTGLGADQLVRKIAVQNDNKILVGGDFQSFNGFVKSYLVRLNSEGTIDGDFKIGYGPTDPVRDILIQDDGKILVCGNFTFFNTKAANYILRLNSDGTVDSTFQPLSGANNAIYSMKLQSDNKILISGNFTTYDGVSRNRLARINANGTLDTSFGIGTGANNTVSSIEIQSDGKILIGGNFTIFNGFAINRIVRLNSNGSRDTTFAPGVAANGSIETIALEGNDKILIGGNFTKYNNINKNFIARLTKDGALDNSFNKNETGANKAVYKIINQDEKFIIVGDFISYNGIGRNRIARIIGGEEIHLSTNDFINAPKIKIFPNPTSDKLFVSSSEDLIKYEVYDFSGQKLLDQSFDNQNKTIEVNHLKKGIYILKLMEKNQKIQTVKFIIE